MFFKEYKFDKAECHNPEKGFVTPYWYQEEPLTKLEGEYRYIPLCFKANVPEPGNYKVTLSMNAAEEMEEVLIFTGCRRLAYKGIIPAGTSFSRELIVNVCDIIPRGQTVPHVNRSVDITVMSKKPAISEIQIEECACPVVYIAGDSTVTDQSAEYPYAPGTSYCGWGQMLPAYFNGQIAVSNHAHSGLTTETFREEGHYKIVEQNIKPGDFFLIQFGHNDQKLEHLQAKKGYRDNLIRYIREIREKEAYPVLITPLARNTWLVDGAYNDLLKEHAQACLDIGQTMEVPVLDLHRISMEFIKKTGLEDAKAYFYPGDYTHGNDYGGYLMGGFVAAEITRVCTNNSHYKMLADCVTAGFGPWKPKIKTKVGRFL